MDTRFLRHYEHELRYLRELGAEFAQQFPKVAGRLGLSELECADPHVERLLEGFAFMAARVQLKLEAEFPRFTQHLMELVYPHYLAPTPSMTVVQFVPNAREGSLQGGFSLPRDTVLRTRTRASSAREATACEYRTCQPVQLWPFEIESVQYSSVLRELAELRLPGSEPVKALLQIRLRATGGTGFDRLGLESLPLFCRGGDEIAFRLHEQLATSVAAVIVRSGAPGARGSEVSTQGVRALGFSADEAMLPHGPRSFHGYRLLQEYFAFPSRYAFVELQGLGPGVRRVAGDQLDILLPMTRYDPSLESAVDAGRLVPFAAPAINLFPRECDRIHLSDRAHEVHVLPDRTRPLDFEVHSLVRVAGHAAGAEVQREFRPMYALRDRLDPQQPGSFYAASRRGRTQSSQQRRFGSRTHYAGSEVFLSLVDGPNGSHADDLRQLSVSALCTNRDLPLLLSIGHGSHDARAHANDTNDFSLQNGAPVDAVRCLAGPTAPRSSPLDGDVAWRLISHLSLNYLGLCDQAADASGQAGAEPLREMLALYAGLGDPLLRRQVDGLYAVSSRPVIRPLPGPGPRSFGRGIEVSLECEEQAFQGNGAFVFGSVLSAFFAKHASINSFTETVLRTRERGEVHRWPTTAGLRHTL
jgi:type VI secretion system protein ImpG